MTKCRVCGHNLPNSDAYELFMDGENIKVVTATYCPYCGDKHYTLFAYTLIAQMILDGVFDITGLTAKERDPLINLMWEEQKFQNTELYQEPKNLLELLDE